MLTKSRSVLRREAAQKGEPVPEFDKLNFDLHCRLCGEFMETVWAQHRPQDKAHMCRDHCLNHLRQRIEELEKA